LLDAAPNAYYFESSNGNTYIWNTSAASHADAEQACRDSGAHLASWTSAAEQAEVEEHYISSGFMLARWVGHVLSACSA
jgi:hypothetical protein